MGEQFVLDLKPKETERPTIEELLKAGLREQRLSEGCRVDYLTAAVEEHNRRIRCE